MVYSRISREENNRHLVIIMGKKSICGSRLCNQITLHEKKYPFHFSWEKRGFSRITKKTFRTLLYAHSDIFVTPFCYFALIVQVNTTGFERDQHLIETS